MKLETAPRQLGEIPIGAMALVVLFGLPFGAWLVETGRVDFAECGFKAAFGLPCLSCGSTRATVHLFHGDIFTAFAFQPLTMVVYLLVAMWGALSLWAFVTRRSVDIKLSKREDVAFKVSLVLVPVVNWLYLMAAGI